jgi:hypothetical protein
MPRMASPATATNAAQRVQRVLARFELGCPTLREYQLTVHVLGKDPQLVVLPAAGRTRGRIELVVTTKGRLRTCLYPRRLGGRQVAAIEDLAWAVYEALAGSSGQRRPAPAERA